jgi:hypothetical protein
VQPELEAAQVRHDPAVGTPAPVAGGTTARRRRRSTVMADAPLEEDGLASAHENGDELPADAEPH